MTIRFGCPNCRQSFEGAAGYRGRVVPCPSCQQPIQVPKDAPLATAANSTPGPSAGNPLTSGANPALAVAQPGQPAGGNHQQQFAAQLPLLIQSLFPPGQLTAVRGQNLSPAHVQVAMQHVCPAADPNSLLLLLGNCNDGLQASLVVTHTHVHSRWRRDLQAIPLEEVATATMPDKYIVLVETASGDKIETGTSLGELRPAILNFFQQVGRLNQQFPRRKPVRWEGKPFPIDTLLLQHWDPQQDLIFRCDVGIPRKRLAGALKTYGQGVAEQDVLALFDNTLLAGGQSGFFFTRDKLYFSEQLSNPAGSAHYWRIRSAEADATHEGTTGKVSVHLDSGKQLLLSHTSVTPLGPLFRSTFQGIAAVSNQFAT